MSYAVDTTKNYVCACNRAFNKETLHPLVSLIDMSAPCDAGHIKTDCYAIVYKHRAKDGAKYGRRYYDYADGTLLFVTPNKEMDIATNDGKMLIFHPNLIRCTSLSARLNEYSFFKYRQDESLHISCREEAVVDRCLGCIGEELRWGIDEYSKTIITNCIELLLNYCRRFYNRQFITRHNANADAMAKVDVAIDRYFDGGRAAHDGLPTAGTLAKVAGMSAYYLNDMMKSETGKNVGEYVQLRRMETAKKLVVGTDEPIADIADRLGFCTEKCFAVVFKKITGCTPEEYRGE